MVAVTQACSHLLIFGGVGEHMREVSSINTFFELSAGSLRIFQRRDASDASMILWSISASSCCTGPCSRPPSPLLLVCDLSASSCTCVSSPALVAGDFPQGFNSLAATGIVAVGLSREGKGSACGVREQQCISVHHQMLAATGSPSPPRKGASPNWAGMLR